MFPLGHIGITILVILLLSMVLPNIPTISIDFRIIVLLAMVPDLIDKTIGLLLLSDTINNGRLLAHTPIFALSYSFVIHKRYRKMWIIYAIPLWIHQILDRVLEDSFYLLYPLQGWAFESLDWEVADWFYTLRHDSYTLVGEVVGGLILLILFYRNLFYQHTKFRSFLVTGRLHL